MKDGSLHVHCTIFKMTFMWSVSYPTMQGFKAKFRVAAVIIICTWIGLAGLYGLLKPTSTSCIMTYMYPTYIPISSPKNVSAKYGLYLYHEGWQKVDFDEQVKKLSGVPVLFIPGNGGSYKQLRSLAAESDRAYQGGPLRRTFYLEASLMLEEGEVSMDVAGFPLPNQYDYMLDWFTVDLEGEHSAVDGWILEENTEYVVYAIHKILDQYKESRDARVREGAAISGNLPTSVILVGHSSGGFIARAAVVHPYLRKAAVNTVVTLASPHQSSPVALQPSLGHYYSHINREWRKGYEVQTSRNGHYVSDPPLSHVVVISISCGTSDYKVRSKMELLDGIVPPTHSLVISTSSMKNVWSTMEHDAILWCNQIAVQVSHALLSLIDSKTGQPFSDPRHRLAIFTKMLGSGIPQIFNSLRQSHSFQQSTHLSTQDGKELAGPQLHTLSASACPSNVHWSDDGLERDLYIRTDTITVLAMDGRRRWLDIQKMASNGKSHFIFVTNLAPCYGVRLHLWPEKGISAADLSVSQRVVEVTSKMAEIPSGPVPRQIEPGSQTEQAPPSAVFWLSPEDMRGFRFLTISVAPRPTVSGRPPPVASMLVGQFFNPEEGEKEFSPQLLLLSAYSQKNMVMEEDHPLAFNLSFTISLGLLPVKLSLETTGCGIKKSGLPIEEAGDLENSRLCKLRCFPPVALVWDTTSGLRIFPNLYSETIGVDSSPALWSSTQGSEKTTVLLLVDPHCSYKISVAVSITAAASRFLLLYFAQILGFSIAVVFFALMRQAHAWEFDQPLPSMLSAVESNLRMPYPFLFLAILPTVIALFLSFLMYQSFPPFVSFIIVSLVCYLFANGSIIILILISQLIFYVAATTHVFVKTRWEVWKRNFCFVFIRWFFNLSSGFLSFRVVRVLRANPLLLTALAAITLACFVHPAFGLSILLLSHVFCCHNALSSHARNKELTDSRRNCNDGSEQIAYRLGGGFNQHFPADVNNSSSPDAARSFGETQLEIFHHRHGLLILHLLAVLLFAPSFVAWLQRIGMGYSFPSSWDSALCIGVILHGICDSKPEFDVFSFSFPVIPGREVRLSFAYLVAGYYSYLQGLALAPYRMFYATATIGVISFAFRIIQKRNREKGEAHFRRRKHSHRY
ncbi:GPI inositol-deacylase isoform X2 [Cornus florida]|uniref:GPI inositol-deacylase isoform X2 n=1 Tax=Cornus florida TaxID=4283 RepID=UPI00289EA60C|nr:GPI inositol-deacylase isoform X2 [Cornus florida]